MVILVTGGAGFIGSSLVRLLIDETPHEVVNVDKLTYAGSLESLRAVTDSPRHRFIRADICDAPEMGRVLREYAPDAIVHLAAESHVDRSIDGPAEFIRTNVFGTFTLLSEALRYWRTLTAKKRDAFKFVHISTDEVFGSLGAEGAFTETTPYAPNSPYSASKASADHLVRAWHHTYGLPTVTTNCSNNYGPFQFPEKLIPLTIQNGRLLKPMPVYGTGANVRDWLFVDDHARALLLAVERGLPGQTYNVGGGNERRNIEVVELICDLLDELSPSESGESRRRLITFVVDRPGHDLRYAIDGSKIRRELGWHPRESFESGLRATVQWYLSNQRWCEHVQSGEYGGERLGLALKA